MGHLHLLAGWIGILLGMIAGGVVGLFFKDHEWLGGYGSWPRRMIRLGHISFIGLGLINVAYGLTLGAGTWSWLAQFAGAMLLAANVLMPTVCFLSAWRKPLAALFPLPVACALLPVLVMIWRLS